MAFGRRYPIWNRVTRHPYRSPKDYGGDAVSEAVVYVGSSAQHSDELCRHTTRRDIEGEYNVFTFTVTVGDVEQVIVKRYVHRETKEFYDEKPEPPKPTGILMRHLYSEGTVSHDMYYSQFLTADICGTVGSRIGLERIRSSKCPHFNDIHLDKWTALDEFIRGACGPQLRQANGFGWDNWPAGISSSDCVCVSKAAAKFIRDRHMLDALERIQSNEQT